MEALLDILKTLPHVKADSGYAQIISDAGSYPLYELLASALQPTSLLVNSCHKGLSIVSMLRGAKSITKLAWVDSEEATANTHSMCLENILAYVTRFEDQARAENLNIQAYTNRFDLIGLSGTRPDMVLIDGERSFEGVLQDLLVCKTLQPRYLMLDNYNHNPDVRRAVKFWADSMGFEYFVLNSHLGLAFFDFSAEQDALPILNENGLAALIKNHSGTQEAKKCWCGGDPQAWLDGHYARCGTCGTLILLTEEVEKTLGELSVRDGHWHDHVSGQFNFPAMELRARDDLKDRIPFWHGLMSRFKQNPATVLEIGCSLGGFLGACREMGAKNVVGVEMDAATCEFARKTFGLEHIVAGCFPRVTLPIEKFDVIAGFDVLERFVDPVGAMQRVYELLSPDGICLFATPCHRGEAADWEQLKTGKNLFLYSAQSVHLLFEKVGLLVLGVLPGINPDEMFVVGKRGYSLDTKELVRVDSISDNQNLPYVSEFSVNFSRKAEKKVIAIGLVEHFGDIVACEPVSRYLRLTHPEAHLVWVTSKRYLELVETNPFIDEVLLVDCLTDWIKLLNHSAFDLVVDLHVNERVCPTCRIPLRKKVGNLDITGENYYRFGSLLTAASQAAGLPPLFDEPQVYIPRSVVNKVGKLALPGQYMVVHCTSNELDRNWDSRKWDELVQLLINVYDIHIVEVGADPLIRMDSPNYINLCGSLSYLETAEVIGRGSLFVGVDSGPAHLANAVGTAGVILLGEYRAFKRYVPYSGSYATGQNAVLVYSDAGSAAGISVEVALAAICTKLNLPGTGRPPEVPADSKSTEAPNVEPRLHIVSTDVPLHASEQKKQYTNMSKARAIAFHLPQFHTIPENDEWWGKGFTEWTNVTKAVPQFTGHNQPQVPSDLGYYDLSDPAVLNAQAALAEEYGISGFCYYHYWFNGKLLLETPLHQMLKSGSPDFPFCLCWANEDWTRAWDGRSGEKLIEQKDNDGDHLRHFYYLLNFFEDKRYIRINGKPLFLVYRANKLPDPLKITNAWRQLAREHGLGELYLCRVESFSDEHTDPTLLGFDAAVEFQPDWSELGDKLSGKQFKDHAVYEYSDVVRRMLAKPNPPYKRFDCVTPSWDNSPRRKSNATIFINATPEKYQHWLEQTIDKVLSDPWEERIVFINAWNEWGEGNHLEPDQEFGRTFLEATSAALSATPRAFSEIKRNLFSK